MIGGLETGRAGHAGAGSREGRGGLRQTAVAGECTREGQCGSAWGHGGDGQGGEGGEMEEEGVEPEGDKEGEVVPEGDKEGEVGGEEPEGEEAAGGSGSV